MNTKQLANVLVKLLGLSVVIHALPGLITGLYNAARIRPVGGPGDWWFYALSSLVLTAIGIYMLVQTRHVTALLLKNCDQ